MNVTKDVTDKFNDWTVDYNQVPNETLAKTREVTLLKDFIKLLSANKITSTDVISAAKVITERLRFI
jgi:hypothetical protein